MLIPIDIATPHHTTPFEKKTHTQPKMSPSFSIKSVPPPPLPTEIRLRATRTRPTPITVRTRPPLPASIPNRAIEKSLTTNNPSFGTSKNRQKPAEYLPLVWDDPIPCRAIPSMPVKPIRPFMRLWGMFPKALVGVEKLILVVVLRREQRLFLDIMPSLLEELWQVWRG